jgi:amino acid adenylation domain-containing protein
VQAPVDPGNAAYVIYTSGSTGRPKGVVVTHGNVARLLAATEGWFGFGPDDVWTLFHSYAFDFSVWEIWGALAYGGRLVVVPWAVSRSPADFLQLLDEERVTVLNQTPSAFRQLAAADAESRRALALRTVVFGGEALDPASLAPWFDRHGDREPLLVNMYGITETTVHVTYRPLSRADLASGSRIGVPIPDLRTHVLDRHFEPMPDLAPGEIHVGGAGLARGYLGRPELTAERFVPDPFGGEPGARLYRSGDLARRRPDGELEYLGRIDHQVKIRGFRIELGEIQAALAAHPDLREAVVLARGRGGDGDSLVAWVVARNSQTPAVSSLRGWLEARLPSYMVPAAFVALDQLPLTPNGKLDRDALPDPDASRLEPEALFEPPHGPAEELLAEIWARVLGVERVGAEDNFFALGGDSIRSIQVRSEAERAGLGFSVQQLFQFPTVRSLAREMRGASDAVERVPPFGLVDPRDRERLPNGLEDAYPLARLQAGMLFHSELSPESAVYHDVFTYHLHGALDADALRAALARVSARHAVLRTSFDVATYREPLQLVHRTAGMPLGFDDLAGLSAAGQEAALAAWLEREKAQPFDWRQAPLARVQVHRRSTGSFQLSLAFHHALLDGWSVASLVTELFRTYTALTRGGELPEEPPPPVAFRDFVAAEQRALAADESRGYWAAVARDGARTRLPRWSMPAGPRAQEPVIRSFPVPIAPEVSDGLKKLSRQAGTPLKSVLLAAHLRCLALLSGEREVTTGLVSNGRIEEEGGERVLGLFLNTVPLCVRLAGGTWLDLVREVFAAERALLPHRRFPMAEVQRMAGGDPLFEAVFNYVHFHVYAGLAGGPGGPGGAGDPGGLRLEGSSGFEEVPFPFAANFSLLHANAPLLLWLDHDATLFAPEQIEGIARLYEQTLDALAADPAARWEDVPLLPAGERRRLLDLGLGEEAPAPEVAIHELFAAQARRTPDAAAVLFDQETGTTQRLTYAELDELSGRLARELVLRGAGPETLVALRARRSPALLAGILGVLEAGAAYLPLDPDAPAERTAAILADSGARLVLDEEALSQALGSTADAPLPPGEARRPVYAIYTSGSTGTPKGVVALHGGLVNFSRAVVEAAGLGPGERILQFAPPSFDASALQIFPALISGAAVVVHPDPAGLSSEEILELCRRLGVTVLDLPAALWRQWVETMAAAGEPLPASIRVYMTGGERLSRETLRLWAPLVSADTLFLSSYGPTEATVTSTFFAITAREAAAMPEAPPPLGRPLSGTFVRLLDPFCEPAPVGTPGEIHLGGAGLARGYLHRPDLTAERFVPDPFGGVGDGVGAVGDRLYRTGDLARFLPDGGIEFLGRTDHQVKIRGFRVEPAEVEAALVRLPGVREAVVLAREHAAGDRRLVAWLVVEPGAEPASGALREALARSLPEFMIPSAFVLLSELPLLPSGKVDLRALPMPESSPRAAAEHVPPRDPVEEIVAGIWADVLGVPRVGVLDDFFALGGHSLVATQVITRIRRAFDIDLQLRHVFESPTVAGVVAAILADPERREKVEKTAAVMTRLANLSDEEVEAMLLAEAAEAAEADERSPA